MSTGNIAQIHTANAASDSTHHIQQSLHTISPNDICPVCINIIQANDHMKDIMSYDAELFDGNNDGYIPSDLTHIDFENPSEISTTQMYTSINLAQLIHTKYTNTFKLQDLFSEKDTAKVLKIKLNLNHQMDSGANKKCDQRYTYSTKCHNNSTYSNFWHWK